MPSFEQPVADNKIVIAVALSRGAGAPTVQFSALFDTGAQVTAISPEVVRSLDLIPTGRLGLTVASGQTVDTFQYRARVDMPIDYSAALEAEPRRFLMGNELTVAGLTYQPQGYDVILGMDFIGMFHITIFRNRIILSN